MRRREFLVLASAGLPLLAVGSGARAVIPGETAAERDQRMAWWREARFGMFIHWGIYAVAAGVWKGRAAPPPAEWIMKRAHIPISEYEQLAQEFNPVKFDADEWAALAREAGMKYLVITAKHHDGFCMFDSALTNYDIMDASPFRRDVLKELSEACARAGIRFGFYYSILDWHHPDQKKNFPAYVEYMKGQLAELLSHYGPIGSIFFDGEWAWQWTARQGEELEAYVRSFQPQMIINNRVGKRPLLTMLSWLTGSVQETTAGDYETPEQFIPTKPLARDWETCMTMNDTWGYSSWDNNWKSADTLLRALVDIASKGGNFLLNVGPDALGLIPEPSVRLLKEIGAWLKVNGESIYGTTAGPFQDLPAIRSTCKPGRIYLHLFEEAGSVITLSGLVGQPRRASLLADGREVRMETAGESLSLYLPPPEGPASPVRVVLLETTTKD